MTNKMTTNEYYHIGTIHRKPERFVGNLHFKKFLQQVLRLEDFVEGVPYENTEHNILVIYNHGKETVEHFGDNDNRLRLYHEVQELLDTVNEPIVHDELFYAVYESEKDEVAIPFANDERITHERLVEAIIEQSVKEKEHSLVIYFTQMDDTDENNMYVVRSICVESYLHGNAW